MSIKPTEEQMKIVNEVLGLLYTKTVVVIHVCRIRNPRLIASYTGGIISFQAFAPVGVPVDAIHDTILVEGAKKSVIVVTRQHRQKYLLNK